MKILNFCIRYIVTCIYFIILTFKSTILLFRSSLLDHIPRPTHSDDILPKTNRGQNTAKYFLLPKLTSCIASGVQHFVYHIYGLFLAVNDFNLISPTSRMASIWCIIQLFMLHQGSSVKVVENIFRVMSRLWMQISCFIVIVPGIQSQYYA